MDIRLAILAFACMTVIEGAATDASKKPKCTDCLDCPQERSSVCSLEKGTENNFRGFRSMCHLTCFNNCTGKHFDFVGNGKCGRFRNPQFVPLAEEAGDQTTISASDVTTANGTATEHGKRQKLKELQKTKYSVD